jgi:hypothetical protein
VVLSQRKGKRLNMWAESDNSGRNCIVSDLPNHCAGDNNYGVLVNYWDGKPAADYTMTMRHFWKRMEDSYTVVPAGNTQDQSFTHSWGISTTDAQTLSASLGYSSGQEAGVNASITTTFSHSVTTDESNSQQISRHIGDPGDGKVRVWLMWQLVHEIVALTPDGKILEAGNRNDKNRKADISWFSFLNRATDDVGVRTCGGPGQSGAWVYYEAARWLFPSKLLRVSQRDFSAT